MIIEAIDVSSYVWCRFTRQIQDRHKYESKNTSRDEKEQTEIDGEREKKLFDGK